MNALAILWRQGARSLHHARTAAARAIGASAVLRRFAVRSRRQTARLGIAIGPGAVYAVRAGRRCTGGGRVWSRALDPPPEALGAGQRPGGDGGHATGEAGWPSLARALGELRAELGLQGGRLDVALLSPLAEARRLELPRASAAHVRRLLAREAERLFLGARGPQVTGALPVARRGSPAPMLAAVAATPVVEAVLAAADAAGWRVDTIVPAHAAWLGGLACLGCLRLRELALVAACDDGLHIVRLRDGALVALRRLPAWSLGAPAFAAALRERLDPPAEHGVPASAFRVAILGPPMLRDRVLGVLAESGARPLPLPFEEASAFAAAFAGAARGPSLTTEAWRAAARSRSRRVLLRRLTLAAGIVIVAAGTELWGIHRDLSAVREDRRRIAAAVSGALERREALEQAFAQVSAVGDLAGAGRRWSEELVALGQMLPGGAYLRGFAAEGDSITLYVVAGDGAAVFQALAAPAAVVDARLVAPIRRVERPGGSAAEEVALRLLLVSNRVEVP